MTPDTNGAGGLPALPEPFMELLVPAVRDAWEAQMRAYGELCRATREGARLDVIPGSDDWKAKPLPERLGIHAEDCARCADEESDAVLSAYQIRAMHDDLREAIRTLSRVAVQEGK